MAPVRRFSRTVLDLLLPPQCLGCDTVVEDLGTLCADCWQAVTFIGKPQCAACGIPFEFDDADGRENSLCGTCIADKPVFERARTAIAYDDYSRHLVLAFKHADRTDHAPAFATWMERAGRELLDDADIIAPVPLHWTRLFSRRYNQAAMLALALHKRSGVQCIADLLTRTRRTPSQGRLGPSARRRNVSGAFMMTDRHRAAIKGKRVLIIDDVMTSGATAAAVTKTLLKGGVGAVDVLTLSRVLRSLPCDT
ncbi:MAG: ComF family protein [Rhodospirillaceae bacterium]|nr:ComF family protein [Rhodospirillaceae bacterium]MBT5308326.1 ComF family protein [Rhodospirillaceae bacterium]MBT7354766.1 ComF family protein [Rhodospirillaceae bacterium]